jgi:hypothetical protein
MARIYLASSWRNQHHARFRDELRAAGHSVYDFKGTSPHLYGGPVPTAFKWSELGSDWESWTPDAYRAAVTTSARAAAGYLGDFRGMEWADTCVMLLPCGRSAHIEAGYMKGRGKRLIIAYPNDAPDGFEPDLMYLLGDHITIGLGELLRTLAVSPVRSFRA